MKYHSKNVTEGAYKPISFIFWWRWSICMTSQNICFHFLWCFFVQNKTRSQSPGGTEIANAHGKGQIRWKKEMSLSIYKDCLSCVHFLLMDWGKRQGWSSWPCYTTCCIVKILKLMESCSISTATGNELLIFSPYHKSKSNLLLMCCVVQAWRHLVLKLLFCSVSQKRVFSIHS